MASKRSMTRNRKHHDDDASASNRKRPMTCASWTDINHDLLHLVMMKLGFGDYYSFRGVCKSWRSFACENENMFMASRPPMSISISTDEANGRACYLEDFEGRTFKTILPNFAGGNNIGLTCGYLILHSQRTHDFWLVNPITRKQLHFPDFSFNYRPSQQPGRFILVFSPSISGWVFLVLRRYYKDIWFCIAGKRAWNHVTWTFPVIDLYAIKGKLYTLTYDPNHPVHERHHLCELRLSPEPKFTLLKTKNPLHSKQLSPYVFVSSSENLYVIGWTPDTGHNLLELDIGNMEWVVPCANTILQYAFFHSELNRVVAVKQQSGIDPRTRSIGRYALSPATDNNGSIRFFNAGMWYFPHECMKVDRINE